MKKILVVSAEYYPEISIGLKETLKKSLTNYDVEYFVVLVLNILIEHI